MKRIRNIFAVGTQFYKNVFFLSLPIALQSLISVGVNMLDTIMVGKLGETELSAVSLANQFINIYHIFCMGIGMGASVLISRYWGMRQSEEEKAIESLRKTMCLMIRMALLGASAFCIITLLIPERLMGMYTYEADIISVGTVYFRYSLVTYFFLGLSLVCTIALRSIGQVRLPLYISIGAFFINIAANYVLIFGKFGFPQLGVAGAALATLFSRIFETVGICGYLFVVDKQVGFRIRHLTMKTKDLLREYIMISIPVLISDSIFAIGNNAVAMVIGRLGQSFVAANAITAVTQQMSNVLIQGVCQSGAIVTGQTLGEGEKEKALKQAYVFLFLGLGLGALSALVILLISNFVIRSYEISEQTEWIARQLMQAISLIVVFQASNSIMTKGVLRGGGDTKMLMLTDNVFLWILSIPLGLLAGFVFQLSPFWIYICLKADQIAKLVWCVFRLRSGKWIKKIKTAQS